MISSLFSGSGVAVIICVSVFTTGVPATSTIWVLMTSTVLMTSCTCAVGCAHAPSSRLITSAAGITILRNLDIFFLRSKVNIVWRLGVQFSQSLGKTVLDRFSGSPEFTFDQGLRHDAKNLAGDILSGPPPSYGSKSSKDQWFKAEWTLTFRSKLSDLDSVVPQWNFRR